jgi:hypothetical protein
LFSSVVRHSVISAIIVAVGRNSLYRHAVLRNYNRVMIIELTAFEILSIPSFPPIVASLSKDTVHVDYAE